MEKSERHLSSGWSAPDDEAAQMRFPHFYGGMGRGRVEVGLLGSLQGVSVQSV